MRIVLIVNPAASTVTTHLRVVVHKALAADHDVELAPTARRGHATKIARDAALGGADVVVVLAGDGTLNEAANGLVGSTTALAPLPGGSTNVYARAIGVAYDPIEATSQLLASLAEGTHQRIGLGTINGRRFLFHAGIGFDAAVVERVERRGWWKRYAAHPLFVSTAVATWARHYDRKEPHFALTVIDNEGEHVIDGSFLAIVSKISPYTYLGRRPIAISPEASLDSALSLVALRSLRMSTLLRAVGSAMRDGAYLRSAADVSRFDGITTLRITADTPVPYQVDGDHLGAELNYVCTYEPDALTLVVPTTPPAP